MSRLLPIISLVLIAPLLLQCSDDDKLRAGSFPAITSEPEVLSLASVPLGETDEYIVDIRNIGPSGSTLIVTQIRLSSDVDTREMTLTHDPLPLRLGADALARVNLSYAPLNPGIDGGEILVYSNDPQVPTLRIPLRPNEAVGELAVNPRELVFGAVPSGTPETKSVQLANLGSAPVTVTNISLSMDSSTDYRISAGGAERPSLGRDDTLRIEVTYLPTGQNRDDGTLVIETTDPNQPRVLVPIRGSEPSPEIDVSRESIAFGALDLGADSDVVPLEIFNEGDSPLVVSKIDLALQLDPINPINAQYRFHDLPAAWPLIIESRSTFEFGLSYHPRVDGRHNTRVVIDSNDADEPRVEVTVTARVRATCIDVQPVAVSFGRVPRSVESAHQPVQITNCGDVELNLLDLRIDGSAGFRLQPLPGEVLAARVAPLSVATVEVFFVNDDLMDGEMAMAALVVENDSPATPIVQVPLTVQGGGTPTCEISLLGAPANFGLVRRGTSANREIVIFNRGSGNCEIRDERLDAIVLPIPGFNQNPFSINRRAPRGRIAPASLSPVEFTYRPIAFNADRGTYTLTFWDPYRMEERTATADLVGVGGDSNIEVIPGHVDFGLVTAGECASRTERVTVYNTGIAPICITDVRLEGPGCAEFILIDRPVADINGCIAITRARPADFQFTYEPGNVGPDACDVVFVSDASDNGELHVPLTGEGTLDTRQTDEFVQASGQEVDVLFVIDNSGSMSEEQGNLRSNFDSFIQGADQFQNDFQLGVVSTDLDNAAENGKLIGAPRIIRRGPNAEQQFTDHADLGVNGAGNETGLEAAHRALTDPNIFDTGVACQNDGQCQMPDTCVEGSCGGHNRGFLRETAALEIVFLSDEEDQSTGTINFYVDFLKSIKGFRNENRMHAHSIVGADNGGNAAACMSGDGAADAGRRYVEVSRRTNGTVASICNNNFGDDLREIGNTAFGLQVQFFLSRPAVEESITVEVDGANRPAGWAFDRDSNSVVFDEGQVPVAGSIIRISYEAECFPRHE